MSAADLDAVHELSTLIHVNYPERLEVLAEKLRLFPRGCFALIAEEDPAIVGYCFSHPWTRGAPPALDTLHGALPSAPASYFIHDMTLAQSARGQGHAKVLLPTLRSAAQALGLDHMSLIAVNGSEPFWQSLGFRATLDEMLQADARRKYGAGAVHMETTFG